MNHQFKQDLIMIASTCTGVVLGAILALVVITTLRLCGVSKYHGYCRPCYNNGIEKEIGFMTLPKKWECKGCRSK